MADNSNERKAFEDEVSSIFEKIKGFTVRETKNSGVISLPNKEYFNIYCSFEPKQETLYNKIKNEKQKLDQTSIIVIATVVALVGATSISILFILKNNKFIE